MAASFQMLFHFITHRHFSICRSVAYVADKAALNIATVGQGLLPYNYLDFGLCQFHLSFASPFCEDTRLFHNRNSLCPASRCLNFRKYHVLLLFTTVNSK
jgi:hypothetical protein